VEPPQTVAELVRADERLQAEFPLITLPVLILHGTADKVTNPKGSQQFFEHAGSSDKTLKLYDGHVQRSAQRPRQGESDGGHQGVNRQPPHGRLSRPPAAR
jgi:hypothetical protein